MDIEKVDTPPITSWYAPSVHSETKPDSKRRSPPLPPIDKLAPTPASLVHKHVTDAETTLAMAKDENNPRRVLDAHKGVQNSLQQAIRLTPAQSDDPFCRIITANMEMAGTVKTELGKLCDEIESRLGTVRELQMAKQIMQKYAQEGGDTINLNEPKTPEQEKDFATLKRLWKVCQDEGVLLPNDPGEIKREELKRYAGALSDAISTNQEQQRKETLEYKRLSNSATEYWELVIATVLKQNQLVLSAIRAIRGQ